MFKILFVVTALISLAEFTNGAMTEAQVKAGGKLSRNTCQPKTKVTNEQIDNMHKGIWDDSAEAKCYMGCITQRMKITKNGKFEYDDMMKRLPQLPEKMREPTKAAFDKCKDAIKSEDAKCEAGYELAKCIYFAAPETYFFP